MLSRDDRPEPIRGESGERHLAVRRPSDRVEELHRIRPLVHEAIGSHEQRARDLRQVCLVAARQDDNGREPFPDRADEPQCVAVASLDLEGHQTDQFGLPREPLDRRDGGARRLGPSHDPDVRLAFEEQREPLADDREWLDEDDVEDRRRLGGLGRSLGRSPPALLHTDTYV